MELIKIVLALLLLVKDTLIEILMISIVVERLRRFFSAKKKTAQKRLPKPDTPKNTEKLPGNPGIFLNPTLAQIKPHAIELTPPA